MKNSLRPDLYVALVHYPVINKKGDQVASAVTNLDLHDIARASRTFGVKGYYVVTPLADQKELVGQITSHWTQGAGGRINPARKEALGLIRVVNSLEEIYQEFQGEGEDGIGLRVVVTSAKEGPDTVDFRAMREKIKDGKPTLLVFGTAWGLAPEIMERADCVLEPIKCVDNYNHLSVRSAASIILDRLTCDW